MRSTIEVCVEDIEVLLKAIDEGRLIVTDDDEEAIASFDWRMRLILRELKEEEKEEKELDEEIWGTQASR